MELIIVTGMSGAGKTQAAKQLEDMGFYCVDNIPPSIIPSFVELADKSGGELSKIAIVTDVRGGNMFSEISGVLTHLSEAEVNYKILFLDAADEVVIRRYKENRRKHPLLRGKISLSEAVAKERKMLERILSSADYVIDTSYISIAQLKEKLSGIFLKNARDALKIQCKSFGFKYGSDTEADVVFDVRCLPNPYYVEDLKIKTGQDAEVREYVMSGPDSKEFFKKITEFINFAVPLYAKEGKSQLTIAFGCTGGKHRSVTFAELLSKQLKDQNYDCVSVHRDIQKR